MARAHLLQQVEEEVESEKESKRSRTVDRSHQLIVCEVVCLDFIDTTVRKGQNLVLVLLLECGVFTSSFCPTHPANPGHFIAACPRIMFTGSAAAKDPPTHLSEEQKW